MSPLADGPRAHVFTNWGTVLYVDSETGLLRHGDAHTSPANLFLVAERRAPGLGLRGRLAHDAAGALRPILCRAAECRVKPDAHDRATLAVPDAFEIVPLERGLVGLHADGTFLCAEPDGRVTFSRKDCSQWEFFFLSEDWRQLTAARDGGPPMPRDDLSINWKALRSYIVSPVVRARVGKNYACRKVVIYGYTRWSLGRVYNDLCRHLYDAGMIVDILDWKKFHSPSDIGAISSYYDLFMTSLDLNGVASLFDKYGVPYERMIALSHSQFLSGPPNLNLYNRFANFGVVSESMLSLSLALGIPRVPAVVPVGINCDEFYAEPSAQLSTVGYASSMTLSWLDTGVNIKRGELARETAHEAGLDFKVAGSTAKQVSIHDMPAFYREVDCVLLTSLLEAAPLPVMEAAAAGRLVIGTPVGHFPVKDYEGGGIIAPIEDRRFKAFAVATLRYYKDNAQAYREKCHAILQAAQKFDWRHCLGDWIELIETAGKSG